MRNRNRKPLKIPLSNEPLSEPAVIYWSNYWSLNIDEKPRQTTSEQAVEPGRCIHGDAAEYCAVRYVGFAQPISSADTPACLSVECEPCSQTGWSGRHQPKNLLHRLYQQPQRRRHA